MGKHRLAIAGVFVLSSMLVAERAHAIVACDALATDTPAQNDTVPVLWIENGDTQTPLLKRIGKQLMQTTGTKVRIIYRSRPTCDLAANFYGGRTLTAVASRPIRYIPDDPAFDIATDPPECLPPTGGQQVMLAIGATFLSSCPTPPTPVANIAVTNGPNQAYGFIVNKGSQQTAITAEEGYFAFGFTAGTGEATPWLDQNLRFIRGLTASTTLVMAAAVGLDAAELKAANGPTYETSSSILLGKVQNAIDQQAAIGILGSELFDQDRSKVKLLAFKTFGQKYAYFPDKTDASFDKQNVRDGHYLPWAPTPYIYELSGAAPANAAVGRFIDLVFGKTVESDVDGLRQVIDSGLVPQCAMKVKRDFDGGDLSLFEPDDPCGCYFEKNVPFGSTTCTACTDSGPCGTGKCRHGYCEAK